MLEMLNGRGSGTTQQGEVSDGWDGGYETCWPCQQPSNQYGTGSKNGS